MLLANRPINGVEHFDACSLRACHLAKLQRDAFGHGDKCWTFCVGGSDALLYRQRQRPVSGPGPTKTFLQLCIRRRVASSSLGPYPRRKPGRRVFFRRRGRWTFYFSSGNGQSGGVTGGRVEHSRIPLRAQPAENPGLLSGQSQPIGLFSLVKGRVGSVVILAQPFFKPLPT